MRKMILIFLLITGTATTLPAQYNPYYYFEPYSTAAEALFNNPRPGKAKVNFSFATESSWIKLELVSIKQMEHLPNLDSILNAARTAIRHLADSMKEDAISRRIDVLVDAKKPIQLRITSHADRPATFFVQKNELALLKTEQDTLRIKFFTPSGKFDKFQNLDGSFREAERNEPAFITITFKSFDKLNSFPENVMQSCLELLRKDVTSEYVSKAKPYSKYTALYVLETSKRLSPGKSKWIRYGMMRDEIVPNIYGSIQFVRGSFVPSMAAGVRFSMHRTENKIDRFYLMWEPYFFFRRDAANKLVTERNDFVTFRYIDNDENDRKKGAFDYVGNFSIGYLTYKKGDWLEKNTIKLGLPGVRSGWLQLEPEVFFNNFFRNFSPSLKLTLHYE